MNRYTCSFVLAATVSILGCKTTGDGAGTVLPPSRQIPAAMKPIPSAPKDLSPALSKTTPTITPIAVPQDARPELEPAKVSLPAVVPGVVAQTSIQSAGASAIREISAVLVELEAVSQSVLGAFDLFIGANAVDYSGYCLRHISGLHKLRKLDLSGTKISGTGFA